MIEICMALHQRHWRVPKLMEELKNQTNQDFFLNIWNNGGIQYIDTRNFNRRRVKIFGTGENKGSQARFKLVPLVSGNPIIFIDDDLSLEKDFVEYNLKKFKEHGNDCILGWFSKRWKEENYHKDIFPISEDEEADYIGTGGMILDRKIFDLESSLQNIPEQYSKVEDMYLGYIARMKYRMKLISIKQKCKIISDGRDQYKKLKDYKQKAFLELRKAGWRLLYDN